MQISASRLESLKKDTNKEIALYTRLIAEKKRIKEEYGFEEAGEEISRYEELLSFANDTNNKILSGEIFA